METTADTKSTITLFNRENSMPQNTTFQQSPPLATHFWQQCTRPACHSHRNLQQWRWPTLVVTTAEAHHPPHLTALTSTVRSPETFSKHWRMSMGTIFPPQKGIQWHTFVSAALACQPASLLPPGHRLVFQTVWVVTLASTFTNVPESLFQENPHWTCREIWEFST